jgi:predicted ATPase
MPPAVTPASALAGRADELALLEGLMKGLARGGGTAALIEGEPGIGKTALARAALASLTAGTCQAFWGTGDELGQELPLSPFLDALQVREPSASARRAIIAGLLRGEVATDRGADVPAMLAEQLIALVIDESTSRPVVLVIDDLQWADPASVRLWGRLARTARQVPLLLIGLTRPVPQREDLLALRRSAGKGARIELSALARPAVAQLVRELAGGRPGTGLLRLAEGAAGNPLYLTELLAALTRSGGIAVTPAGTAQLAAETVPGSLTSSGTGTALAFRYPLIREALYAELPAAVRGALHRDAGHALAAAGAAPDRVARQLLRALGGRAGASLQPDSAAAGGGPAIQIERPPACPAPPA